MAPNMFSWFTIVITSCQLGSRTLTLDSAKQYQFQIFESSIAKNTKKGVLDDMITNNIPANRSTYTQVAAGRRKGYYLAIRPMVICDNTSVVSLTPQQGMISCSISISLHILKNGSEIMIPSRINRSNKRETRSYFEISQSLGVDSPAQILFITDVFQEAVAAKSAGND